MDINLADFRLQGTFLSLFSLIFIFNQLQIKTLKKKRDRIHKEMCYSPNEILNIAKSMDFKNLFEKQGSKMISKDVLIYGTADSQNPIKSRTKDNQNLVLQNIKLHQIQSNDLIFKSNKQNLSQISILKADDLKIMDIYDLKSFCEVGDLNDLEYVSDLQKIGQIRILNKLSFLEEIQRVFYAILRFFKIGGSESIVIGYKEKEIGIKLGSTLSIVGQVVINLENNTIKIEHPKMLLKSIQTYKSYFTNKIDYYQFYAILSLGGIVWCCYNIINKFIKLKKKYKKELYLQNHELNNMEIQDDEFKCIICLSYCRNIILKPCFHLVLCKDCFHSIPENKMLCPYCRKEILDWTEIKM